MDGDPTHVFINMSNNISIRYKMCAGGCGRFGYGADGFYGGYGYRDGFYGGYGGLYGGYGPYWGGAGYGCGRRPFYGGLYGAGYGGYWY